MGLSTISFYFVFSRDQLVLNAVLATAVLIPRDFAISDFMLGIEDVGIRTEQPFDVLPLWQYVEAIDASCAQILNHRSESTR